MKVKWKLPERSMKELSFVTDQEHSNFTFMNVRSSTWLKYATPYNYSGNTAALLHFESIRPIESKRVKTSELYIFCLICNFA